MQPALFYSVIRGNHVRQFTPIQECDGVSVLVFPMDGPTEWFHLLVPDIVELRRTKRMNYASVRNGELEWCRKRLHERFGYVETHLLMPSERMI